MSEHGGGVDKPSGVLVKNKDQNQHTTQTWENDGLKVLTDAQVGRALFLPPKANKAFRELFDQGVIQKDFLAYYEAQLERIAAEKDIPVLTEQQAFDQEGEFFSKVTDAVEKAFEEQPGRPIIAFWDADETVGRIPLTNTRLTKPGLTDIPPESLTSEQQAELKRLEVERGYEQFQLRPSFVYIVNYLKEHYPDLIQFGIITTKEQEGLDLYFAPKLQQVCPNMFSPELIMSSADGKVKELLPELYPEEEADENLHSVTLKEAAEKIVDTNPISKAVIPERIIDNTNKSAHSFPSAHERKILMMMKIVEEGRKKGQVHLYDDPLEGNYEEDWISMVRPETAVMLFEDVVDIKDVDHPVLPHDSSLIYVPVKRFRLPEDYV